MTINSGNIVKKPAVVIDPNFFIPPHVVDLRYKNDTDFNGTEVNAPAGSTTPESAEGEIDTVIDGVIDDGQSVPAEPVDESLPIPAGVTLISQTTHLGPGGGVLVDIVLEVPDMPGVSDVDVRVTRII